MAVGLARETNTARCPFADFVLPAWVKPPTGSQSDENARLDPEAVTAVAVGCVNPMGVGTVVFTVTDLRAVGEPAPEPRPVTIDVTGRWLDADGQTMVPARVFGGFHGAKDPDHRLRLAMSRSIMSNHATGGKARFGADAITHTLLNCAGERIWPAARLIDAQWKSKTEAFAREMGTTARQSGKPLYVEFWNEPYLNWANRNRANFIPRFYDESRAAEGGPVHIKHDGQVAPHLKWTKQYDAPLWNWCDQKDWRRGRAVDGKVLSVHAPPYHGGVAGLYGGEYRPETHPPLDVADGETYTAAMRVRRRNPDTGKNEWAEAQAELTAFTPWHIYDETQMSYWSGRGMLTFYVEQMEVFGPALKAADPNATFFAGWGMRPSENRWASFHMLYKPTIDAGIDYIDGVHGHDYGGGPLRENAIAEVIAAYGMTQHGKRLEWVHTEMSGMIDPQAYPEAERETRTAQAKAAWLARKILHGLSHVPDKLFGYSMFAYKEGEEGKTFELLSNLRGRLVHLACDDPFVYAVAAVDGTDPENPRPAHMPKRKELVVALFNDNPEPRSISLDVAAPPGTSLSGFYTRHLTASADAGLAVAETKNDAAGAALKLKTALGPRSVVTFTFPLEGDLGAGSTVRCREFFTDAILRRVTPGAPYKGTVAIDTKALAAPTAAWVQFVAENLDAGEAVCVVGGREYPMPACVTPDNTAWLRRVAVHPEALAAETPVEIRIVDPDRGGFLLCSAGIVVQGP
jgi:hypothetical protein